MPYEWSLSSDGRRPDKDEDWQKANTYTGAIHAIRIEMEARGLKPDRRTSSHSSGDMRVVDFGTGELFGLIRLSAKS